MNTYVFGLAHSMQFFEALPTFQLASTPHSAMTRPIEPESRPGHGRDHLPPSTDHDHEKHQGIDSSQVSDPTAWSAIRHQLELVSQSLSHTALLQSPSQLQSQSQEHQDHTRSRLLVAHHVSHAKAQIMQSGAIDALVTSLRSYGHDAARPNAAETLLLFKELASSLPRPPPVVKHTLVAAHPRLRSEQHQSEPADVTANLFPNKQQPTSDLPQSFSTFLAPLDQARPSWSTRVSVNVDVRELNVSLPVRCCRIV
ncbi:hypothetical protein BCR44DRAFT_33598 [Catenaria anguillulae PL171]|uniref:Uncharacterized protein n=1 Tax=Catenaria anguillulae PL171 TaxID=765915 RepID=A0A1Y2HNR7_9FUNG|nr:hypothetical protein BCR44DRAFT_33598 [Catenaria anguillulae PL171]